MTGLLLQKNARLGKSFVALFFVFFAGAVAFSLPQHAFAITLSELTTPSNGWQCTQNPNAVAPAHLVDCTKGSSTAYCVNTSNGDGRFSLACFERNATGQTVDASTNTLGTTVGAETNGDGPEVIDSAAQTLAEGAVNLGLSGVLAPFTVLFWVAFKIGSFMLGLAGVLFNWTIGALVFQFAKYLGNSPGMLVAWGILRDFGNIGLLFGFVFMGISTILDLHSYPWKKALPNLVIFAVLLNFSLFAAEAVIDTSNVLAASLYDASVGDTSNCNAMADLIDCLVNNGIAGEFLTKLQISSTFDDNSPGAFVDGVLNQVGDPVGNLLKFVGLALVTTIAAVVLFAGAMMLISRAVILAFLMVTSPIGFAGMAIPGLQGLAKDWWKKLIDQALFAPVFILLLLVALKMTDGVNQLASNSGGLAGAFNTNEPGSTGILLLFTLIIGFMLGSLMLASKFGIYGADFAIKTAGNAVYGTMGAVARTTLGRGANRLGASLNSGYLNRVGLGTNTFLGRRLADVANYGAKSSFDVRGAAGGAIKGMAKVDLGKVGDDAKKGFRGETDASNKKKNEYAKARSDAWSSQDKAFAARGDQLDREETVAMARAAQAEREGNTAEARRLQEMAGDARIAELDNATEAEAAKRARLTEDERLVRGYNLRNVSAGERAEAATVAPLETATAEFTAATAALTAATTELAATEERLATLRREPADGSGRNPAEIASDIRFAEEQRRLAEETRTTAETEAATARLRRDTARRENQEAVRRRADAQARSNSFDKKVESPKHAMEQIAQSFERMANARLGALPVGQFLDPERLRAGAAAVRKDQGQTDLQKALHAIEHEIEHAAHAGGHGDDHAPAAAAHAPTPAGGGGGGHAPAPH